ncbi:3-phosphoshikimate 1-carboxyvinyltransferase [Flavobacterium litorale]|uniref:3-phosphoshikimate 1-carboxyvinyltransferase n=1 Tax=Flavobacterium litorale TaxID=2856519 RepID=A0ABX8V2X4_9FLAO|nr:3-phosphoshikimate 1-carboxyvinyltransferase [Flavobacterium litorale]QYJ67160.1 3-phosphoshikimate 1-carboxyvinyltransferase [Flavobacterium litorale]
MDIKLSPIKSITTAHVTLSGSKSETNRLLVLQALFPHITITNTSNSDDSTVMQNALNDTDAVINVHHAGTAMRFLTAYSAIQQNKTVVLTGSSRMQQRPIGVLVKALRSLGVTITYLGTEGYPPLQITGKKIKASAVSIAANVSSQYITALLLIAPKLKNGLQLTLSGEITSLPYINMTLALLNQVGIEAKMQGNTISVQPIGVNPKPVNIVVESDWSSASYFYAIVALAPLGSTVSLSSFKEGSLQGDAALATIYNNFGVTTHFHNNTTITLTKSSTSIPSTINLTLNNTPDIAQTIATTCFGLGVGCNLTGLHTLKIKETDRLQALKTELQKLGAIVTITNNSFSMQPHSLFSDNKNANKVVSIATYNDHRMAMAFAPLALKTPIIIEDAAVVSKSFLDFWEAIQKLGFAATKL